MKIFHINFLVSLILIIGGFLCPPMGVIDGSILSAVGLLLLHTVVEKIPEAIREGQHIKITGGNGSVEFNTQNQG